MRPSQAHLQPTSRTLFLWQAARSVGRSSSLHSGPTATTCHGRSLSSYGPSTPRRLKDPNRASASGRGGSASGDRAGGPGAGTSNSGVGCASAGLCTTSASASASASVVTNASHSHTHTHSEYSTLRQSLDNSLAASRSSSATGYNVGRFSTSAWPLQPGTTTTASSSVSRQFWLASQDIATKALNTRYIQGIAQGKLDPNYYGQYVVQDCVYCYHAADCYRTVVRQALALRCQDIADFARERHNSFRQYNESLRTAWHISPTPGAVELTEAARAYVEFEEFVTSTLHPIYGIVAMTPCNHLWPWLAAQILPSVTTDNLYRFWIEENDDWHGARCLDNFIDGWFSSPDHWANYSRAVQVAQAVYSTAMLCELNLFRSACGEELEMTKEMEQDSWAFRMICRDQNHHP